MSRGDETPATGVPRLAQIASAPQVTSLSPATANQAAALLCTVSAETMVLGGALTAAGYVRRRWATADAVLRELAHDLPEPTLNALLARLDYLGNVAGPAWLAGDESASRGFRSDLAAVDNAVRPLRALALRQRLTPPEQQATRRLERALADPLVGRHLDALGHALRGLTQLVALSAPAAEDASYSASAPEQASVLVAVPDGTSKRDAAPAERTAQPVLRIVPVLEPPVQDMVSAEAAMPTASAATTSAHDPEPAASATVAELGAAPLRATAIAEDADPDGASWGRFHVEGEPEEDGAGHVRLAVSAPTGMPSHAATNVGESVGASASRTGVPGEAGAAIDAEPATIAPAGQESPLDVVGTTIAMPEPPPQGKAAANSNAKGAAPVLAPPPLSAMEAAGQAETPQVEAVALARPLAPPVPLANRLTSPGTTREQGRHTWSPAPPASQADRSRRWAFSPDLLDAPTLPDPGSAPSPAQPAPPPQGSTRVANVPFDPGSVTYAMPGSARGYMRAPRGAPPPPPGATPTWQRVPPSWPLQHSRGKPRRERGALLVFGALAIVLCAAVALVAVFTLTLASGTPGTAGTGAAGGVAQHAATPHPAPTHAPTHAPPTATPKPLPAVLAIAPTSVRVPCPSSGNSASLALRDTGGEPLRWQVSNPPIVLYFSAYSGTIGPGASSTLSVHALWGSKASRAVVFTSDGGSVTVNFTITCH